MDATPNDSPHTLDSTTDDVVAFWQKLLHRWLIEFNPLYLLSAALVFGGTLLLTGTLQHDQREWAGVGMKAIVEAYAWALILGAAFLTRIGLRRPATMLALLTVLYQGDLMLVTETYAYPGWLGIWTVAGWWGLFIAKLQVLTWALRLRLSPSAFLVPALGAAGLALMPRALYWDPVLGHQYVMGWAFALSASALWTERSVTSRAELDAWGQTVLRRSVRATWIVWGLLVLVHVAFWGRAFEFSAWSLVPVALLVGTRWLRRELAVWVTVGGTLVLVGSAAPPFFPVVALLAAATLALRALRRPTLLDVSVPSSHRAAPYRVPGGQRSTAPATAHWSFRPAAAPEMARLLVGSIGASYLSLWTEAAGWAWGEPWPGHVLVLDLAFAAALLAVVYVHRLRFAAVPLVATWFHLAVQTEIVTAPRGPIQWGATAVLLGFGLLGLSLTASWWWQRQVASGRSLDP